MRHLFLDLAVFFGQKLTSQLIYMVSSPAVRQRQDEKKQLEECSKVKERKRKREKYAEKVQFNATSRSLRAVERRDRMCQIKRKDRTNVKCKKGWLIGGREGSFLSYNSRFSYFKQKVCVLGYFSRIKYIF